MTFKVFTNSHPVKAQVARRAEPLRLGFSDADDALYAAGVFCGLIDLCQRAKSRRLVGAKFLRPDARAGDQEVQLIARKMMHHPKRLHLANEINEAAAGFVALLTIDGGRGLLDPNTAAKSGRGRLTFATIEDAIDGAGVVVALAASGRPDDGMPFQTKLRHPAPLVAPFRSASERRLVKDAMVVFIRRLVEERSR